MKRTTMYPVLAATVMGLLCTAAAMLPRFALAQTPLLILRADDPTHITVSAGKVTNWTNEVAGGQVFSSGMGQNPSFITGAAGGLPTVRFNGGIENDVLRSVGFGASAQQITVFVVTAARSNAGNYRAFISGIDDSSPGHQDYLSGFNIDQGVGGGGSAFDYVNFESVKAGGDGGHDFRTSSDPFGTFSLLTVSYGDALSTLYVNGVMEGSRTTSSASTISLQDVRIGGRYFDNGGGPFETGFLDGDISEVQIYDSLLTDPQRQTVEQSLINKYGLPGASAVGAPEPGSIVLFLTGCGIPAAGAFAHKRRRQQHINVNNSLC